MKKRLSGFPIKREKFFTLNNGTYVVHWNEHTVRTLLDGKILPYRPEQDYGAPLSDFELRQLKQAQVLSHFNQEYVWLTPRAAVTDAKRVTRVSKRIQLTETGEMSPVTPRASLERLSVQDDMTDSMDTVQLIRTMMSERQVMLILQNPTEQELLKQLLSEMQFDVVNLSTAQQGLLYLEEHTVNLLITDLYLPDMHAWQMIAKVQEIAPAANIPVLVITDEVMPTMRAFAGEHISRPVSVSRLRYHLWKVLQERMSLNKPTLKTVSFAED
jgi:PleD family two-component response regulator